jgi:hypothetical protein
MKTLVPALALALLALSAPLFAAGVPPAVPAAPAQALIPAPVVASIAAPAAATLPSWEPALVEGSPSSGDIVPKPIFLISCSSCVPAIKCFKSQACLLADCC